MASRFGLIDCNNFYVSCERVFDPCSKVNQSSCSPITMAASLLGPKKPKPWDSHGHACLPDGAAIPQPHDRGLFLELRALRRYVRSCDDHLGTVHPGGRGLLDRRSLFESSWLWQWRSRWLWSLYPSDGQTVDRNSRLDRHWRDENIGKACQSGSETYEECPRRGGSDCLTASG